MNDNSIVFKIINDEILIILDDKKEFEDLHSSLEEKIKNSKNFFENASISISFKGKQLKKEEEEELVDLIKSSGAKIKNVSNEPCEHQCASSQKDIVESYISSSQNDTIFHRGSIRGGQSINHNGSVVVIGDVNPGGEIIAAGNIIVMGALKGLAHAGSKGNRDCFVAALSLIPSALRIADIITSIAEEYEKKNNKKMLPTYAYIHEGQIYIAPLV